MATTPEVGMGATYGAGSDCYPATVVKVSATGKALWATDDEVMILKSHDEQGANVDYVLMTQWEAAAKKYTLRKNGTWIPEGVPMNASYTRLSLGHRRYYRDPSF